MKTLAAVAVASLYIGTAVADYTEELTWTLPLNEGGRISLENINGNIEITGNEGEVVEIVAVKKAGSEEYLEGIEVLVDHDPDQIRIESKHPNGGLKRMFSWGKESSGSVSYTLHVPASANLDGIESVNGDVSIAGVGGVVKASTVNGGIVVDNLASNASIETVNGSVEASFDRFGGGQKANCESVNGKVTVRLPKDADTAVSAETINGGIDGGDFGLQTNKGFIGRDLEGRIGDGAGNLDLSTVNGSIRIRKH